MSQMREPPILRHRKNNHIPYDIVLYIMERLPVKSVMRLRCVSKSMDSLITSHDFISAHLKNISKNHDHENGYVIHLPSWEMTRHIARPLPHTSFCTVAFDSTFERISEGGVIYLWNPSIRKFKRLPDTCLRKLESVRLGFAYHSENGDYKVVRISSAKKIEVYTLSSDSWRSVEISSTNSIILYPNKLEPAPFVSGALHWMALIIDGQCLRRRRSIMSFDVNTETFRELALPNYTGNSYCIALFKGKLTFTTLDKHQYSIWVMKKYGVVESWNKLFVVPFQRAPYCLAFTEYGSLLVSYCYTIIPMRNEEFKFVLIDAETLHEKKDPDIQHPSYVATFMESLVLLDGANLVSY